VSAKARVWVVWDDPTTDPNLQATATRGPQRTRPREHARAVVVDSWPADDPPPANLNDAAAWGDWRRRQGVAS